MLIKGILVKLTESHPHNRILALFKINFYQKKKKKGNEMGKMPTKCYWTNMEVIKYYVWYDSNFINAEKSCKDLQENQ